MASLLSSLEEELATAKAAVDAASSTYVPLFNRLEALKKSVPNMLMDDVSSIKAATQAIYPTHIAPVVAELKAAAPGIEAKAKADVVAVEVKATTLWGWIKGIFGAKPVAPAPAAPPAPAA